MYIYRKVFLSGENFKITFEEYNKAVKEKKYPKTEYSAWMQIKRQIDRNPTGKYFVTYNMQMQTLAIRCGNWRFGKFNVTSNCATGKDFFDYLVI